MVLFFLVISFHSLRFHVVSCVIALVVIVAVIARTFGYSLFLLFLPQLFVVVEIVSPWHHVGVKLQFYHSAAFEISVAVNEVLGIAVVLDGVEVKVQESLLVWQNDHREFIACNEASACCLYLLYEERVFRYVLYLIVYPHNLALHYRVIVPGRVCYYYFGRL